MACHSHRHVQKLIEQMAESDFCDGKAQYKYQPPVPVDFSNPVSAHTLLRQIHSCYCFQRTLLCMYVSCDNCSCLSPSEALAMCVVCLVF